LLEDIGLMGFLKTTGGKGLPVVVPIRAALHWDHAKGFTNGVADFPVRYIRAADLSRRFRGRRPRARYSKIFIDYLRNAERATVIAPYAMCARASASVSTPIS